MRKRPFAVLGAALLLAGAWMLQLPPSGRLPDIPALPPLPASALRPVEGKAYIALRDVRFTLSATLTEVTLPLVEVTPVVPELRRDVQEIRIDALRIVGLRAIAPIDTIDTPLDLFTKIPGPRLRIGQVSIVDAEVGERDHPDRGYGPWFYHFSDLDIELRGIDVAGRRAIPERLSLTRLDFTGEVKARPMRVTHAEAQIARTPALFDMDLSTGLGLTELRVRQKETPAGDFQIELAADTMAFAELYGFFDFLPREGTGKAWVLALRQGDSVSANIRQASAQIGASRFSASGQIAAGATQQATNLMVELRHVRPEDMKRAFDVSLPGQGPYDGTLTANGVLRSGVRVNGVLRGYASAAPSSLTLSGIVQSDERTTLDLQLLGDPIRLADTAFALNLRARGPLDTLAITGTAQLRTRPSPLMADNGAQPAAPDLLAGAAAALDLRLFGPQGTMPRRLNGNALLRGKPFWNGDSTAVEARAQGEVVFAKEPTVRAVVTLDSLPLETRNLSYFARGTIDVNGLLDAARATGGIAVLNAATRDTAGTATGWAILDKAGALHVDARANAFDLRHLPLPTSAVDSVRGRVSGEAAVRGTMSDPSVSGLIHLAGAGARVVRTGTRITGMGGDIRIEDDVLRTNGLAGRAGSGTVLLSGSAQLTGERALALTLNADSAQLTSMDSASVVADASVKVAGTMKQPVLSGRVRVVDGYAKEDLIKKSTVIDPDDPPYTELAARVPWLQNSRLRRAARQAEKHESPLRGRIDVELTPAFKVVDEDSEIYGHGLISVVFDSSGIRPTGGVQFTGGYYANFGERFLVRGGSQRFTSAGMRLTMRAENDVDRIAAGDFGSAALLDWYPNIELFAFMTSTASGEELRRMAPLSESQAQVGALLIYGDPPTPIAGWYQNRIWLPQRPSQVIGRRTQSQGGPLLWSYTADEAYDHLPLSRAGLRSGIVTIGSRFPGRIVQGPLFRVNFNVTGSIDVMTSLAPVGDARPGLRVRWRNGNWSVLGFNEPKFYAAETLPGYFSRRRSGVGLRWDHGF